MLSRLKISNFVLIDKLDLDFKSGLTVLTGETGSGKSIIIDAVMLIFGARVTIDLIRHGCDTTDLMAEFELSNTNAINWLKENDLADSEDQHNLICRRIIDRNGKNKIYLNGHTVTATQMKDLSEYVLDIHTQHAAITLLKQDSQRLLLDEYAGISDKVTMLAGYYKKISSLEISLYNLRDNAQKLFARRLELEEQIDELASLNLKSGEWEELERRHKQISNMGIVVSELTNIQNLLNQEEYSLIKSIHVISSSLNKIVDYVPKAHDLLKTIESIEIDVAEFNHDIGSITKSIELEPNELQLIEEKIEQIFSQSRKYHVEAGQIPEFLVQLQEELATFAENTNLELLEQELAAQKKLYNTMAQDITNVRNKAAVELSKEVTKLLHTLAIQGEFKILLTRAEKPTSYGLENIEFNVAFNQGTPLQPLAKVASGGELSRTALVLYLLLSMQNSPETIIFDEIDVGIGGVIASHIGKMLHTLGEKKQVICITHQAQTASFGANHLIVAKKSNADVTILQAEYATSDKRTQEIARMIGGIKITDTTISHARELLEQSVITQPIKL